MSQWLLGDVPRGHIEGVKLAVKGASSMLWSRAYSDSAARTALQSVVVEAQLTNVLAQLGAARMVVGHTPQPAGCNADFNGRVWRVDVGMSAGVFDSPPQLLELAADGAIRVLS